jgi:flagellar biosynthesis/type III secretory pathway protein FliH
MHAKRSWHEPVALDRPLRDVRPTAYPSREAELQARVRLAEAAAYERGRLEGEKALSEQLVRQRAELQELQNGVLDALQQVLPRLTRECERELVAIALEAAGKLVAGLPVTPEMVEAVVREALGQVEESASFAIEVHPDDLSLLQSVNSPILLPQGGVERVTFQGTPEVGRGGCVVHSQFGTIDARRSTKVELLREAIVA